MKACTLFTSDNEVAEDWLGKFDSREPLDIYGQKYLIDEISTDYEPGFAGVTIKMYPAYQAKSPERPKKQEAWNGEGLPPVGTVCYRINVSTSTKVEIIAHFDCTADRVAAYIPIEGRILVDQAIASCFKPIKTKEEIEKEKYLSEILVISNIISMATGFAGPTVNNISRSIYEAGYRNQ